MSPRPMTLLKNHYSDWQSDDYVIRQGRLLSLSTSLKELSTECRNLIAEALSKVPPSSPESSAKSVTTSAVSF